jgi:hypothetical protein
VPIARPVDPAPAPSRLAAVHPLLFAAYPVLFLWSQNLGETNPSDVVRPLLVLVAAAALLTWVLGRVLTDRRRAALIVSPLVIGLLMYWRVAVSLAALHVPGFVQQAGWIAIVIGGGVAAVRLGGRKLAAVDTTLDVIAGIFVVITLVLIAPFQVNAAASRGAATVVEPQAGTTTVPKRDVYLLIFDRYGSDRAFDWLWGFHNDLSPWLREHGFTVLDDSHANYVRTPTSMATTLNMIHLKDVPGLPGPASSDLTPVHAMLQSSLVVRQFKELGYRNYHIGSWWGPTSWDAAADVNLNLPALSDFENALFDESAIPAAMKRFHVQRDPVDVRERHYRYNEYGLAALASLRDAPGPKFVFAHILLPHPPMVYDSDGRFLTLTELGQLSGKEQLRRQLAYTNTRIREILGSLLALPEAKRPIIILQADEGPESPTYRRYRETDFDWADATDEEVEVKFGIMNAWYLPGGEDLGLYPSMTSINTFPVLFSRYFGLNYPLLPDRVYTAKRYFLQYDLTDVTDRLPSLR